MAVVKAPKCMQRQTVEPFGRNKIHIRRSLRGLKKKSFLCARFWRNGFLAEWLGTALQKLLQRFESARNLQT